MADEDDELSHYGYGRARGRSSMYLVPVYGGEGSDDDTEESSTSPGSFAMGMPRNTLLISLPVRQRSRSSTSSGGTYSMMGSLMQMLFGSSAMDESSDETKPLPLPPAKGEKKDQPESSKDQSHKPRNSDEEMDRLRKIIEQGVQKQKIKEKSEEERTGEISDATGQDIDHDPSETQSNLQETDEVKVDDQHLTDLETTLNEHGMESDSMKADIDENDDEDDRKETTGHAVSIETNIQRDKILPLSQQLKKDADKSMNFLKSLWSVQKDNPNSVANNSNIDKPVTESDEIYTETSQVQSNNSEYHHTDNIQQEKLEVDDIRSCAVDNISPGLSEDGVISPGEKLHCDSQYVEHLPYESSRSISFAEQDLSDGESLEEDCDYSNDLGGAVPEHDLEQEISSVKGQAKDQSPPIEVPLKNDEKLFKSKLKDDFDKAQESADDAVKALEKGVNEQKTKGDNPSSTEPGDLKSGDSKKPVTSNEGNRNIKSSQSSPDYYDDDLGDDYDEKYGYSPMNSKYAKLAKSPLATQLSRLTGVMSGMQSLAEQHGFEIKDVIPDGNCMFSALVDQLRICGNFDYNTQSLRKAAVSYLRDNPYHEDGTHLQSFLYRETWDEYLQRMEKETVWGDHMVLQACTEVLECKIYVYKPSTNETVLAPNSTEADDSSDLYLGHVGESHFVSLRRTDWEKMWHLKAQIHRNRRRNRKLVRKYLKTTAEMNTLKKKSQALEKTIENLSFRKSLPSEISIDQQEEMSKDMIEHDGIASASSDTCRQSSLTSEHDGNEDVISPAEEVLVDEEEEPPDTEISGACSDVKTLVENKNAFDNDSQLPLLHLSYLIENVLRTNYMCTLSDATVECKTKTGSCQMAGSVPEGLNISLCNYNRKVKSVKAAAEKCPKLIVIQSNKEVHLSQEGQKGSYDLILENSNCHSGYTNLRPFRPDLWDKRIFYADDHKPLLTHMIMSIGPSRSNLMSKNAFSAFRCIEWPKEAAEWLTRERPNGWPSEDAMRIIKSTDCLVISRAHPLTKNKGIEWQIIFPQAEQILAKECLTKHQLYCFKVFKILVDFHCREKSTTITTTHLKTVLFYACEEIPIRCWSENIGGCVLYLLEKFLMFLMARDFPNYFIKRNNMIYHVPESDMKFYEEKVHALRIFPVIALYILAEEHGINQISILIDPILEDAAKYQKKISKTRKEAKEVFITTTMKLAMYFMEYEHYSEGCNIAQKAYEELLPLETDNDGTEHEMTSPAMSFQDFILKYLQEEYEENKYTFAYEFDKRLQTHLCLQLQNGEDSVTLKDLVGKEVAGSLSNIPIPKSYTENTTALVMYIVEIARRHYMKNKLEDSACLLRCAITKAKSYHEEMVDVSQVEDIEIRNKVSKQNYRKMVSMNCYLMDMYHHLYQCYCGMGQVELIQEYIHDFEEVCERMGQPYYYKDLAEIWQSLGQLEKSREIRKKLKTLSSSSVAEETWL